MENEVVLQRRIELPESGKEAIVVSINRPGRLNCFNTKVVLLLAKIFSDIALEVEKAEHDIAAVIFTGEGPTFCAGADLANPPNPLDQSSDLPEYLRINPVHQMGKVGVPIIGALKGHVITGGFELALACDILVGEASTKFRDTHVKFGLAPCWGLSQKLQQKVGPGRAKLASLTSMPIKADLAYQWGLLDEKCEEGTSSLERSIQIADMIGSQNGTMVQRYKRAIVEGGNSDLATGLKRERALGLAHYLGAMGDGSTFENAKTYITNDDRPRSQSKL